MKNNIGITIDEENPDYYTNQIITYIGNKRSLLLDIENAILYVKKVLNKDKLLTADLFSGSGIVARLLKKHSNKIIVNDIEEYSRIINQCFLTNKNCFSKTKFDYYLKIINKKIESNPIENIISNYYAPKDTFSIKMGERAFYTHENAVYIDSFRKYIDDIDDEKYKDFFIALLITEASVHVNTCGVFKGFYKDNYTGIGKFGGTGENALSRIMSPIVIKEPILSNFNCDIEVYQDNAVELSKKLSQFDLVYLDPPYNQHPYGSNYFMLNIIAENKLNCKISDVSGIPENWNRSDFNKRNKALISMEEIIKNINSKFILISYNNEGFISYNDMVNMLSKYGELQIKTKKYNAFRGSHNLKNRNLHTDEYMFLLRRMD